MKKFKHNLYKYLIDKEKFYMKQYFSKFHQKECYVAMKELQQVIYCVLISNEKEEDIDSKETLKYLKTLEKPFIFNLVILSDEKYINSNNKYINKIVINEKNYSTILCDSSCIPLENIINKITKENIFNLNKYLKNKIATLILISINIVVFIITAVLSRNIFSIDVNVLIEFGAKYNDLIYRGEIYRLLTSAFLHGGIMHIACNMYMLYIMGIQVEKIYGVKKYYLIYFISGITSSVLSLLCNKYISVGASGAIFGLLGSMLIFGIKERHKIKIGYISNLIQIIVLNLIIGFSVNNIDNSGHIGGFIGGVISTYVIILLNKREKIQLI